jgi:hypothetical protein
VNKAGPNLKLFNQLFWTVLTAFVLVLLGTYPTSHQLRGIYPEGTKRGKICLQLYFPEDKDFLDEGLKLRIMHVIFPFLFGTAMLLLNLKVKRFLAGHCPRKRMSCIGVYQRNVITYTQTTCLVLCWVLSAFLNALLVLLVELNIQSWSPQTVFWIWNTKGLITDVVNLVLPVVLFVTPPEEAEKTSPVDFYTRKAVTLEPRRPEINLRDPILVREMERPDTLFLSIPPPSSGPSHSSPSIKYFRNHQGDITIVDC